MSPAYSVQNAGRVLRAALLTLAVAAPAAGAQSGPTDYRDEFLAHFSRSSMKMMQLSAAMPESLYTWSPGEGVRSVAEVYMHIARYNYLYLDGSLGVPAPDGVDWQNFESVTDKATIVAALRTSVEHVQRAARELTEANLTAAVTLYGRQKPGWAVLFQLLSHMNEHVGQAIAYARMNGVVPPWSR